MSTVATRPSHLPTTYSSRVIGRASIASVMPDSTSAEIAGDAANTAENASTKLNMNITRMRSCDATAVISVDVMLSSRVGMREKPHVVSEMTTTVSSRRTRKSRRRSSSCSCSRAIVSASISSAVPGACRKRSSSDSCRGSTA